MSTASALTGSRALWNRDRLELSSDEVLAQVLDRGEMAAWRELYHLAALDAGLRRRIHHVVLTAPLALPHFWLAALAALGEEVELGVEVPPYPTEAEI